MSGVHEAAASLFGPEEESSDPFAVIGDTSHGAPEAHSDPPNLFPDDEPSTFLDSVSQDAGVPYEQNTYHTQGAPAYESSATGTSWSQNEIANNGQQQYPTTESTVDVSRYQQPTSYGEIYSGNTAVGRQPAYDPSSYQPYAPVQPPVKAPHSTSANQRYTPDRYAPPPPAAAPATDQGPVYPYDYSKSNSAPYSLHATTSYLTPAPPTTTTSSSATTSTSPLPKSTVNRPKVVNAYDPPFPTTTRRTVRQTTTNYGTYGAYQPVQPLPPPSPFYASNQFAVQQSQPPPRPPSQPSSYAQYAGYAKPKAPPVKSSTLPPGQYDTPTTLQRPDYTRAPASYAPHSQENPYGQHNSVADGARLADKLDITADSTTVDPPQISDIPNPSILDRASNSYQPPPAGVVEPVEPSDDHPTVSNTTESVEENGTAQVSQEEFAYMPSASNHAPNDGNEEAKDIETTHIVSSPAWPSNDTAPTTTNGPRAESLDNSQEINPTKYASSPPKAYYSGSYLPPIQAYGSEQLATTYDPYAPPQITGQTHTGPVVPKTTSLDLLQPYAPSIYRPQVSSPPMVSNAYAPSPSLVGANDPLARVSARAPVISFGFGGRFVTCFHGAASLDTGFDVALSTRNTTSIKIHTLNKLLPRSALSLSEAQYPGPLFADPGGQSIGLVRSTASAQAKSKKARVLQYLETRAAELNQGLGYLNDADRRAAETRLVLVNLLGTMVEHDGKLSGFASIDNAVRLALVPRLSVDSDSGSTAGFTVTADAQTDLSNSIYSGGTTATELEQPISVTSLRPSALNKIEELLMRGERKQAYVYALDQKLWAHAMVIASSIDKDAWKAVVNEFIQTELTVQEDMPNSASYPDSPQHPAFGRDSLRVAYRFFSGQGASAVQELIPKQPLSRPTAHLQPTSTLLAQPQLTPRTPAFPPATFSSPAPESLAKWRETITMMIASPPSPDTSITLTTLGDQLLSYNWLEAAHVCYLLSPQTSPLGGSGSPAARITLLGSKPPHLSPLFSRNPDHIIFSEILEFALSLVPTAKGQEGFGGLNHLQPYRLLHAASLAELGYIQEASRYCEAITASIAKPSPYFTPTFVHQLRSLMDRISGVSHSEKSNSWIGGKISKPSLDSIGGWLEGRFTKLVTGDGESDSPKESIAKAEERPFDGPFAHYSAISTTPSARSSPQPRLSNVNGYNVPQRTSSAMAMSSPYQSYAPIDRASSAIDYIKHSKPGRQSPAPPVPPLPSHLNHGFGVDTSQNRSFHPVSNQTASSPLASPSMETPTQPPQASSWWDYGSGSSATPTAAAFMQVDGPAIEASNEGFISLMDSQNFGPSTGRSPAVSRVEMDDELEDLGFGNSKKKQQSENHEVKPAVSAQPPPVKQEAPLGKKQEQQPGGGWLSRWWKSGKDDTNPAPIKANLGEENSFYYDKELKRWVNKKAGAPEAKPEPGPPPPPSRAQTASPSKSGMRASPLGHPPPPRSSSAMGMTSEAPPVRVRSNLVPTMEGSSTPPPPPMSGSRPPSTAPSAGPPGSGPPSRPRSQATKKNLRSRYVDVFQQEGGST